MNNRQNDLQASIEDSLARHHVAGASIAVIHGSELITAAAGVTNVTTGVEITPETVMHIGSITKVFNATLVMQLVDEGTVDLDERVLRYLPDLKLKDREALEQITVKMLLNHTSGIDGEWLPDYGHDEETIEKGIARFAQLGQLFRPGAEFSYCNVATVIAGFLVQRLRGKSWHRLVRKRIFEPLQMQHAATLPEEALLHRASVGHHFSPTQNKLIRSSFAFGPLSFAPAGSTLMMCTRDLIKFAMAHVAQGMGANGARILSARSAKAMQQMTVSNKGKGYTHMDMGIGWMVADDGLLHHSGGGPGVGSVLYAYPERESAAAILTNSDNCLSLIIELMEPWLKEVGNRKPLGMLDDVRLPLKQVKIDSNKYVGVYEDVFIRYRVSPTPDGLALSRQAKWANYDSTSTEATPPARLIPLGDDKFLLESDGKDDELPAAFRIFAFRNPDAEGHMQHLGNGHLYPRVL